MANYPTTTHPTTGGPMPRNTGASGSAGVGGPGLTGPARPPGRRETQPTLRSYQRFVRRHRVLIVGCALLGATVGGLLVANSSPEYIAKAKVAVTAQPTGADIDPDRPNLVSLDSDAQILSSSAVLTRAAETAGFPGGGAALSESLDVSALPNSRVLIVRVSQADRAVALRACGAILDEFLRTRAETESERGRAESEVLNTEITDVLNRLGELRAAADATGTAPAETDPLDPATSLLARLVELEDELRRVTGAGSASPGTIVLPPTAPSAASRPMAAATAVSGLLIGALAGVGGAGLRDNLRGEGGLARRLHVPHPHARPRRAAAERVPR